MRFLSTHASVRDESGATMAEFIFVALFLLIFILVSVWMLYVCYAAVSVQFIATAGLRRVTVGPIPGTSSFAKTQIKWITDLAKELQVGLDIDQHDQVNICPLSGPIDCGQLEDSAFNAGELIAVRVRKRLTMPMFDYVPATIVLEGLAIGKNEPFKALSD